MSSKRFLALFGVGFITVALVTIAVNMYIDIFALFRPVRGRTISIYGEERIAKYLHSFRYIPENFDGVLLGSSVSENFSTQSFSGYRIYNASINGGNIIDVKPLVDNIYRKGALKITIICIHRYLTKDHVKKTDFMTHRQYWGALGSPQLMTAYVVRMAVKSGLQQNKYDEMGTLHFGDNADVNSTRETIQQNVADIRLGTAAIGNYYIDPVALAELGDIVDLARRHSEKFVIFYPPTPAPVLYACAPEYERYRETINGLTQPGDIVVDFNGPGYERFRDDFANFIDGVHLSSTGANAVMLELGKIVQQSNSERRASFH